MLWLLSPHLLLIVKYRSHVTSLYLGLFVSFFLDMRERERKRKGGIEVEMEIRQRERHTERERFAAVPIHAFIH